MVFLIHTELRCTVNHTSDAMQCWGTGQILKKKTKWKKKLCSQAEKEVRISLFFFGVLVSQWRTRLVSFCLYSVHANSCSLLIRLDVKLKVSKSLITETNYVDLVSVGRLSPRVTSSRLLLLVTEPANVDKLSQFSKPDYAWNFYTIYLWIFLLLSSLLQRASLVQYQEEIKSFSWLVIWLMIFEHFIIFK